MIRSNALKRSIRVATSLSMAIVATPMAFSAQLLKNGNFETGTFSGWTVTSFTDIPDVGTWFIDAPGTKTPLNSFPTSAADSTLHGSFYAVIDQRWAGHHALSQSFTWSGRGLLILTFDMFANDWGGGPFVDSAGLDYLTGPNQHIRVDILSPSESVFNTTTGVVMNLIAPTIDPHARNPNPFTSYVFDLSGLAADNYLLRFGEVDNEGILNMGVDNVSLQAISEPSTFVLFALGLAGMAAMRKRRK